VIRVANEIESTDPWWQEASSNCYYCLAIAHKELGREGGIDQAIVHVQKSIERQRRQVTCITKCGWRVLGLAEWCYVNMGRIEETMHLHKSIFADIGKESVDPAYILEFSNILKDHTSLGLQWKYQKNIWTSLKAPGIKKDKAKHSAGLGISHGVLGTGTGGSI